MDETYRVNTLSKPCRGCPWKIEARAQDIPNFDLARAESLAGTCPDEKGFGPGFFASWFACHQSVEGNDIPCAGWLAMTGSRHPRVRMAVGDGRLDAKALTPKKGWPALHSRYTEVLAKLRADTAAADEGSA